MDDMMPRDRQSLADLIGSRLCHDLSNPLGAIGNGVELLDLTGSAKGPEMDLIRDAVGDALARVRFFRLAFGHAGPDHMTSAREARTTLRRLCRRTDRGDVETARRHAPAPGEAGLPDDAVRRNRAAHGR
jgi:hypothetical protein